jgi:hypothetical protein
VNTEDAAGDKTAPTDVSIQLVGLQPVAADAHVAAAAEPERSALCWIAVRLFTRGRFTIHLRTTPPARTPEGEGEAPAARTRGLRRARTFSIEFAGV